MFDRRKFLLTTAAFLLTFGVVPMVRASEPPADLCSLLSAAELGKVFGQSFDGPQKSIAPRPAPDAVPGTDCSYPSTEAGSKVLLRVYVESSVAAATGLFLRMSKFYETIAPVNNLGDEAYLDTAHGLHVRKGKVRFLINLDPASTFTPEKEKQIRELAVRVVAHL